MATDKTPTAGEQLDSAIERIENRIDRLEGDLEGFGPVDVEVDPKQIKGAIKADLDDIRGEMESLSIGQTELQNAVDDLEAQVAQLDAWEGATSSTYELVGNPDHTRIVKTGPHTDTSYHEYGSWGVILSTNQPVHWREATIHAEDAGRALIEVYPIDAYSLGPVRKTREIDVQGGPQTIYPEITLPTGTWFITRDTDREDPVHLKRTLVDVDWTEFSERADDLPVTFQRSWQIGREPGTEKFESYEASNWHRILHHFGDWEFGFMDQSEGQR